MSKFYWLELGFHYKKSQTLLEFSPHIDVFISFLSVSVLICIYLLSILQHLTSSLKIVFLMDFIFHSCHLAALM